jgi:DNA-3-methyladenine glycosylase
MLDLEFFNRDTVNVAQDLLGQIVVFCKYRGVITETEAYRGSDDPASHSFNGPTSRSGIMFGRAGVSYVYLIYGMYHCLNIVTENVGNAGAVLIRGLKLFAPVDMLLDGPGKLCRQLNINRTHNNIDLIDNQDFHIAKGQQIKSFNSTARIGIKVGTDKLWRFSASALS